MRLAWILPLVVACSEHGSGGGGDGGGSGSDGGSGAACGGILAMQCAADEFCDFPQDSCGIADESGTCKKRPATCPDPIFEPTCGCDNMVRGSACETNAAGFDVNANMSCPVEAGRFACGFKQCVIASEYCERADSDIGGEPTSFTCKAIPTACPSPATCGCLAGEPCGGSCAGEGKTGLTLHCFGG